ncbi:hypothetical protein ACFXAE_28255 [Streptomyces sp. NPDC059454]|uniref:hypothetical protein n=1 Tax=Streptomyces sp. NPDC059454 TaxID=3346836 RepID=UPI0036ADF9CD
MTTTQFQLLRTGSELEGLLKRTTHTWTGILPGSGAVGLKYPQEANSFVERLTARVAGEAMPALAFHGIGFRGAPRLALMKLEADGRTAELRRRHLAVTRQSRALRIELSGRSYRYRVLDSGLRHELRREGAVVTMTRSERRRPQSLSGVTRGEVDALDLGLAILLEGVYTRNLSFGGALFSWPGRFLNRMGFLGYFMGS